MSAADDVRAGLRDIMAGGSGEGDADPFAARNDWEDTQRKLKKTEANLTGLGNKEKPRSRRAQQAQAKAVRDGTAVEDPDTTKAPLESKQQREPDFAPTVAPASRVILPAVASWYEHMAPAPADAQQPSAAQATELRFFLAEAYDAEVAAFSVKQRHKHGADHRIVQRLTTAGTVKDRVAALTVQVHESSFHSLHHMRALLSLAERPRPEVKLAATEAMSDLFLQRLLPPNRGLRPLEKCALPPAALVSDLVSAHADRAAGLEGDTLTQMLQAFFESELKEMCAIEQTEPTGTALSGQPYPCHLAGPKPRA